MAVMIGTEFVALEGSGLTGALKRKRGPSAVTSYSFQSLRQCLALDEFHHNAARAAGFLEAVNLRDVGMSHGGQNLRFTLETRKTIRIAGEMIVQHLQHNSRGGFPPYSQSENPAALSPDASQLFFTRAATPPCGDARRGIVLDSSLVIARHHYSPWLQNQSLQVGGGYSKPFRRFAKWLTVPGLFKKQPQTIRAERSRRT